MNVATATSVIRQRFKTEVSTPKSIEPRIDNESRENPGADKLWVRLSVIPGDAEQVSTGDPKRFRTPGIMIASIFGPFGKGDKDINELADFISTKFRCVTQSEVVFQTPKIQRIGRSGPFWQVNVICPWYLDTLA